MEQNEMLSAGRYCLKLSSKLAVFVFAVALQLHLIAYAGAEADNVAAATYTLEEILLLAQKKNPSVSVFRANIDAARGALVSAKGYPNPEITGGIGWAHERDSTAPYRNENFFGLAQPFEWPGKRQYRRKTAEADLQVAEFDLEDFRLELRALVKDAFYNVVLSEKSLEVAQRNLQTAQGLVDSAKLRVDSGEAPELELLKAQVEFMKIKKDVVASESRVTVSRSVLNSLLGGSLESEYRLTFNTVQTARTYDLNSLIESAIKSHPRIQRQEKAIQAAEYAIKTEQQSRYPDINVEGSSEKELDKSGYSIGLSIPIPILYRRQGEIAVTQAAKLRAQAELQRTRVDLTNLITQEYQNYQVALNVIGVFEEGLLKQAEEALRIAQFSYQQGETDLLELLDAQRTLRNTLIEYYDAQFQLQSSLARLERVAGELPQ
ncbi:TolC family protein [bacterium]|nr:TolC family protein [bacterium]